MTKTLRSLLREDYIAVIKSRMMELHHTNTTLARDTGYSSAHIGNILQDKGSDSAISAVCRVLGIEIIQLYKEQYRNADSNTAEQRIESDSGKG